MEKYNLTAFSKGAELRVSWYPTERPQGMAEFSEWQSSKVEYKVSDAVELPTDSESEKWFEENIGIVNNCSASSAIYKFRLWLRERK